MKFSNTNKCIFLFITLLFIISPNIGANGMANKNDETNFIIENAFLSGISNLDGCTLQIEKKGKTTILTGKKNDLHISLVCLLCNLSDVAATARTLGAKLALSTGKIAAAHILVKNLPANDLLFIDNIPTVFGQDKFLLVPGNHILTIFRGNKLYQKNVHLLPNQNIELTPGSFKIQKANRSFVKLSIILLGLGIATIATAVSLIHLDGKCGTSTINVDENCAQIHETAKTGYGALAIGISSLATGLVFAIIEGVKKKSISKNTGGSK